MQYCCAVLLLFGENLRFGFDIFQIQEPPNLVFELGSGLQEPDPGTPVITLQTGYPLNAG